MENILLNIIKINNEFRKIVVFFFYQAQSRCLELGKKESDKKEIEKEIYPNFEKIIMLLKNPISEFDLQN